VIALPAALGESIPPTRSAAGRPAVGSQSRSTFLGPCARRGARRCSVLPLPRPGVRPHLAVKSAVLQAGLFECWCSLRSRPARPSW